jgi:transcription initiation factor TFIIIB Brf1 subunit/transcription initiation factor TFIIB
MSHDDDWASLLDEIKTCDEEIKKNNTMAESYNNIKNNVDLDTKVSIADLKEINKDEELEETSYNYLNEKDRNTNENSFMTFNIVGKQSYCLQRSLLKTCANYSSYRTNSSKKEINNYNYQYDGKKIPNNAIKIAFNLFTKIKENGNVYRGFLKKGVIGSCMFYACVMVNMSKTPREISSIMNIEDRFISKGDKELQKLNKKGIISIPTVLRPLLDYIDQYFPSLNIPYEYKQFVVDIIDRSDKKDIHIENDCRTTTKCIGVIYLLANRVKALKHITKELINKDCKTKPSTFIKHYNLLMSNGSILKPIFKKHKIPMPRSWKVIS